jgi:hypothetical protein
VSEESRNAQLAAQARLLRILRSFAPTHTTTSLWMTGGTLPLCLFFGAFFAVCYGTTSWLAGTHAVLPSWSFAFESRIPFVPSLSLVYLTITPALLLAPFVFRTRSALAPFAAALCIETFIASIFFLLLPQTPPFVRPPVIGWVSIPFALADTLNSITTSSPRSTWPSPAPSPGRTARPAGRSGASPWRCRRG